MIELHNLTIRLNSDGRTLISGLDFTLGPGDKCAIIGEEGNGKSTLLKLIDDPVLVQDYVSYTGTILKRSPRIGYLAQELPAALREERICDFFAGIEDYRLLSQTLAAFGMDFEVIHSERILSQLSGGEKVKLRLARILADAPDALLLDEPTNDIDLATVIWLEDFIGSCETPILYVSHDETLIENTANVILHLEQLRKKSLPRHTVERIPYSVYVEKRLGGLAKQEQLARKQRSEHKAKVERWHQLFEKVEHRQNAISRGDPAGGRLLKKKMKALKSQQRRLEGEEADMVQLPDVEDAIDFTFSSKVTLPRGKRVIDLKLEELTIGERTLARDIALTVTGPERIGIIGANGSGKTTLLRRVWEELSSRTDISAGYMPQNYADRLDEALTPIEFLCGHGAKDEITQARTVMGAVRFTHEEMTQPIAGLSGGQRAKLLFIEAILKNRDVLVLDEPTRNFSPLSNPVIRRILTEYGGAIISVSHDRLYLDEVCTRILELTPEGLTAIDR